MSNFVDVGALAKSLDNWFEWALANGSNPIWAETSPGQSAAKVVLDALATYNPLTAEQIAERCGGYPLSGLAIAGILAAAGLVVYDSHTEGATR
jgi:hypothetical protein